MNTRKFLVVMYVTVVMLIALGTIPVYAGPGTRAGTDASVTPSGGTFFANSPAGTWVYTGPTGSVSASSNSGTALRKFVDSLPGLGAGARPAGTALGANNLGQYIPLASAATMTVNGQASDYYEIGLKDYTKQMHTDLPKATKLRGYYQKNGTDHSSQYLGPLILATKDRPVRIKFFNELGANGAGDLFIPMDPTYMGAGTGPDGRAYSENRATLHLHGGHSPWISDGTPHQWITPSGENSAASYIKGDSQQNVPDMDGGVEPAGVATFYWTNNQSGRLMFYHDHAYGTTRLNVYAGEAAGYIIADPTEENSLAAAGVPGNLGTTPDLAHLVPLIIQDKTFVPQDIAVQDAQWTNAKWGTYGDLWLPHVYETNQWPTNPDLSGANNFGRWDYGPWFWPIFPVAIPGLPTMNVSGVPESFMDTPIVNGTAYPYLEVQPTAYRLRVLNACNDRMLNLSLFTADPAIVTADSRTDTEVKMVAAIPRSLCSAPTSTNCVCSGANTPAGCFPPTWPTDARLEGVPDPATMGPSMIQIGTEGGLLPQAVEIPAQPVNYEYNRRTIVVLNVTDHALFIGPAERADVIVDFSAYAGKTVILYNDSPAPVPAFDPRFDYYTGDPDNTWMGGAPSTPPGYGPNTRTVMQFRVANTTPSAPFSMATLTTALPGIYATSQPAPVVPQTAYPAPYNGATDTYSLISSTSLTFTPVGATAPIAMQMKSKTIQELFTPDYGRMNATLGTELPFTSALIQTTIPLGYIDPGTEIVANNKPQIWKITHNGVDTHAIHFHLTDVQVINRVGWDGAIRPPDANELGWKDTVKMNPLEDIVVAMRPTTPPVPFNLPNSIRPLDVTQPLGSTMGFTAVDPYTNNPVTVTNAMTNFGWEYVWHCHLLGHEENDMMRPIMLLTNEAIPWYNTSSGLFWDMMTSGTQANTTGTAVYTEATPAQWSIVGKGDFDGDGITDYVWWNNTTGQVRIMLMVSPNEVLSQAIAWTEPNTAWRIVATGDLNGDGKSDLIWWNNSTGQVAAMLMNGAVVSSNAAIWTESNLNWKIVATGDLNGDGKADIIWWNSTTGQVFGMLMNGLSVSSSAVIWTEPGVSNWRIAGTGDLNGDGKADLVWRSRTTGQVFAMLMNGLTAGTNAVVWTEPSLNWEIVSIDNYTTDTKADLLWRNKTTGMVFLLPMNGLSPAAGASVPWTEPSATWRIEGTTEWKNNVYGVGVVTP